MKTISFEINQQICTSFYILLRNCASIKQQFAEDENVILRDETTVELLGRLFDIVRDLEDTFKEVDQREILMKQLCSEKDKFRELYDCYFAYSAKTELLQRMITYYLYKQKNVSNVTIVNENEKERLINFCMDYVLASDKDAKKLAISSQKVLSAFPFKLAKSKYYDYVQESIVNYFEGSNRSGLDAFLDVLRSTIFPEKIYTYGKYFTSIFEKLDSISDKKLWGLTSDELNSLDKELDDIDLMLYDLNMLLEDILEIINGLFIALGHAVDLAHLTDTNLVRKDLFYSVKEILDGKESFTLEKLLGELDALNEENVNLTSGLSKRVEKELSKAPETPPTEDTRKLIEMRRIVNAFYCENLMDLKTRKPDRNPFKTKEEYNTYMKSEISNFVKFLDQNFASIDIKEQKLLKRFSLGLLPFYMSPATFIEHLRYSLDSVTECEFLVADAMLEDAITSN